MSKKKSPKPPKHVPWTQQPPATIYAAFTADRLYHVSTERAFAEQEARDCLRSAQVFAYTRIPADEGGKLEEIRSRCERWAKTYINSSGPENIFPNQILKILQKNKGKTT